MFNIVFDKMENKKLLDNEESKAYILHKNRLKKYIISFANAIIMMVTNSRDVLLYNSFKPQLVVVNKAIKSIKPDM